MFWNAQYVFQQNFAPWLKIRCIKNSLKILLDPGNNFSQGFLSVYEKMRNVVSVMFDS